MSTDSGLERPGTSGDLRARIRASIRGKLGRCPNCMRWSALGMLFSWIAVAAAARFGGPIVLAATTAIAAAFTTLFVLHVTTFTSRVLRGPDESVDIARRQFLVTSAKVGAVAVGAAVSGAFVQGVALAT